MAESIEADQYLLEQVRRGDADGWRQFVARYEGRLLAFARGRVRQQAMAEDLVQETFLSFLQSMQRFRMESSIETYLFCILRRKVIDLYRGREDRVCSLSDAGGDDSDVIGQAAAGGRQAALPANAPAASWYARRDERDERLSRALGEALAALISRLRDASNLRDLKVVEACFYAQRRNKDIALLLGMDEKQVALIKHRCVKELREYVGRQVGDETDVAELEESEAAGAMLTEVWERQRLTCPKRSTIGRYLLGTLDEPWQGYVGFHLDRLGCRFCRANAEDIQRTQDEQPRRAEVLYHSTVGFLRSAGGARS
jgi:RNA polymerase sigma factor (sigma-70 family)